MRRGHRLVRGLVIWLASELVSGLSGMSDGAASALPVAWGNGEGLTWGDGTPVEWSAL